MKNEIRRSSANPGRNQGRPLFQRKSAVIFIIVGIIILAFILLLFLRPKIVGRAIFTAIANPILTVTTSVQSSSGSIIIKADVGAKGMDGAAFKLSSTTFDICTAAIADKFGGLLAEDGLSHSCSNQVLTFDDGLTSKSKTGEVELLQLNFAPGALPVLFSFSEFTVIKGVDEFSPPTQTAFTCSGNTCTSGPVQDGDTDGVFDNEDNCPTVANANQADSDGDGVGTACDNCPDDANPAQTDTNGNDVGDACEVEVLVDGDTDGVGDDADNCPGAANADQVDADNDGVGDVCDTQTCGNIKVEGSEECDGVDLKGATCSSVLGGGYTGKLGCQTSPCTYDTSACIPPPTCGNGKIDQGEECDGTLLGSGGCTTEGLAGGPYTGGTLSCAANCQFDAAACTASAPPSQCTEAYCKSTYGLILPAECSCPTGDSTTSSTPVDSAAVNSFCSNIANTNTCQTMCNDLNLCPDGTGGYTVDINGDQNINGQDAFIILKIAEALVRDECGSPTQNPCGPFSGTYTCDSGDFRVQGYKGFAYASQNCAQLANTANYVK